MLELFRPLLEAASGLDLSNPTVAVAELAQRFDPTSEAATELNARLKTLADEGKLADRGELPVRWGRVAKPSDESLNFSIDVVVMNGAGPRHRHPNGEVNYCVALDGNPTFDLAPAGWVVKATDSTHIPTVDGGTMLIVYLLPDGAMEFLES